MSYFSSQTHIASKSGSPRHGVVFAKRGQHFGPPLRKGTAHHGAYDDDTEEVLRGHSAYDNDIAAVCTTMIWRTCVRQWCRGGTAHYGAYDDDITGGPKVLPHFANQTSAPRAASS